MGVGVIVGIYGIWQQYVVQSGVNYVIVWMQRNIVVVYDEVWQSVVCGNVNWFWVGCGVVEGLYYQVCREVQVCQVFQFIMGYWIGGVLRIDGGYFWFVISVWMDIGNVVGVVNYFLCQ